MPETQDHIALFLSYLGGGGAERVMLNLARGFADRGLKVDLVLAKAWGPHLAKIPPGIRVVNLEAPGLLASCSALAKYLRREQPTVLLSALHYTNEIGIVAKRVAGVSTQIVVSEHNTPSESLRNKVGIKQHLKQRLTLLLIKYLYPWADGIVTVSQGAAADMVKTAGLPADRIQVIYNPVVTPELMLQAKQPLDHPWFKPGEPPVLLGVGKLETQKDFPTLIRAFAKVRQVQPARLMILGWGPDRRHLESLIAELGLEEDVALPGYIDNPFPYMANAGMFVLSSAWEGLPTVLIEALALGVPIVSTDCKSGPFEILQGGQYGALVPVGDSEALAQAILRVLAGQTKTVEPGWLEQFGLEAATQNYLDSFGIVAPGRTLA